MRLPRWTLLWLVIIDPFARRMVLAFYLGGVLVLLVVVVVALTAAAAFMIKVIEPVLVTCLS